MSKSTLFALALVTLATNIHSAAVKPEVDLNKCRVSNCGKTGPNFIQPRVIGGRAAKVDEFPFHAAIFTRPLSARPGRVHQNNLKCGGNMINDQWILTSAECVWDVPVDEIRVSVAIVDIGEEGDNGIQVEQVIVHPAFVPDEEHDDIALLKVKSIKASSHHFVNPICLPFADMEKDVQMATVAGFGAIHPNTDPQDSLQMTTLPIQPDSVCKAIYFDLFNSTSMICAGVSAINLCHLNVSNETSYTGFGRQA